EGSYGDPFVEMCRYGRCGSIWFRSAGWTRARGLRFGRLLQFHGFPPMSSMTNQIGDGKASPSVGRCQGVGRSPGYRTISEDSVNNSNWTPNPIRTNGYRCAHLPMMR